MCTTWTTCITANVSRWTAETFSISGRLPRFTIRATMSVSCHTSALATSCRSFLCPRKSTTTTRATIICTIITDFGMTRNWATHPCIRGWIIHVTNSPIAYVAWTTQTIYCSLSCTTTISIDNTCCTALLILCRFF